jgi:hypothetical protein
MNEQAYALGVKLAVARWREAIQAGELGLGAVDELLSAMKFDPMRYVRGMHKGTRNIAKRYGIPIKRVAVPPTREVRKVLARAPSGNVLEQMSSVSPEVATAIGGGYAGIQGAGVHYIPGMPLIQKIRGPFTPLERAKMHAQFLRHEVNEAVASNKVVPFMKKPTAQDVEALAPKRYTITHPELEEAIMAPGATPQTMHQKFVDLMYSGQPPVSAMHADPRVVAEDLRSSRLLYAPGERNPIANMRQPEIENFANALGVPSGVAAQHRIPLTRRAVDKVRRISQQKQKVLAARQVAALRAAGML